MLYWILISSLCLKRSLTDISSSCLKRLVPESVPGEAETAATTMLRSDSEASKFILLELIEAPRLPSPLLKPFSGKRIRLWVLLGRLQTKQNKDFPQFNRSAAFKCYKHTSLLFQYYKCNVGAEKERFLFPIVSQQWKEESGAEEWPTDLD